MTSGQVKLRGQRVELGEIEDIASKTDGVQLAMASIIDDVLVLFCAARDDVKTGHVIEKCKSWLPPYMRPAEVVFIKDIPRLPSGKIDRKALERDYRKQRASTTSDSTFDSSLEEDIAQVLSAELGIQIDRTTSFWSLGVDSLRAIKLASKLRPQYESVSAAMLSEGNNVAELAALLGRKKVPNEHHSSEADYETSEEWQAIQVQMLQSPDIDKHKPTWEKVIPCSSMQVAMLAETAATPAQNFNDIWLRLAPGLKFSELRRAFEKLSEKNEILRSGFFPTGRQGMPFAQVVWPRLTDTYLSLLHPLKLQQSASNDEDEIHVQVHHALCDGWSWDVIVDDLNTILTGHEVPMRTQFSAFRSFEQLQLQANASETLEYWHHRFQDFKPSAFPRLSATTSEIRCREWTEVPLSISYERLSDFASSLRCSRETVLEAAWCLLLSSYVDETDVATGLVSAGRHHSLPGIETVIGPCLSVFPLRVDFTVLRTAHDLINHIQRQRSQCLEHGSQTLRGINDAAGLRPGERLFDTLCVWQQDSEGNDRNRSKVTTVRTHDALEYAIVLEFEPRQGKIFMKITFDADRIPEAQAKLLALQLDSATTRLMSNSELRLDCFWEGCSQTVMSMANTDFDEFSGSFDITSTISKLAKSDPERVAIEFVQDMDVRTGRVKKDILTYRDLLERASAVASALQAKYNLRVDDLVCLIGPRSIQLYIGILGTIMAGGAYICIDPHTPAERTRQILSEAKSKLILTAEEASAPDKVVQTSVHISDLLKRRVKRPALKGPTLIGDELAYAVFTSGSTGVPKGVLLTRRNLLSNLEELSRIYSCEPETDRLLQSCSPAFDVSVFEIFWTWHKGMTLCTASNDVLFKDLEYFINKLHVTHLSMTPSVAALVHPDNVPHVKMLVTAGEPMNSRVFADWAGRGLYQGYGPSETTNICNVRPRVSKADTSNNVGPPLPNTSVFICERQVSGSDFATRHPSLFELKLVPRGGAGEVWIGGEQVGRGYIDPALTAKSFFDHPEYGRSYRSGDIGRLLCDGSLVILGREDDQVKLRGQRVELGEINAALVRCDEIEDAVSLVIDGHGEAVARLVSFWTPRKSDQSVAFAAMNNTIYDQVSNILPGYMIPDALLRLDQIPLTRQGKANRRNLIALYEGLDADQLETASRGKMSDDDAGDLSEDERVIARTLADVLGVQLASINRSSSFFALGIDSISAIHVARGLRHSYPTLEISTLLRNPSINQLMRSLNVRHPEATTRAPPRDASRRFPDALEHRIRDAYSRVGLGSREAPSMYATARVHGEQLDEIFFDGLPKYFAIRCSLRHVKVA